MDKLIEALKFPPFLKDLKAFDYDAWAKQVRKVVMDEVEKMLPISFPSFGTADQIGWNAAIAEMRKRLKGEK